MGNFKLTTVEEFEAATEKLLETGKLLVEAGADVLVAGNAVFKAPDMIDMIHQLKSL